MSSSAGAALANVSNTTRAGYKAGSKRATKPAADCLFHNPNTAQQQDTGRKIVPGAACASPIV